MRRMACRSIKIAALKSTLRPLSSSSSSSAAAAAISDYSLSKNLKLRGVIFSLEVLVGNNTSVATGPASDSKTKKAANPSSLASPTYDTTNEIEGISTVTSKYGAKLAQRLGGATMISSAGGTGEKKKKKGDATLLMASRKAAQQNEREGGDGASRWLLVEGMGSLLDYTSYRTIPLCCFPLPTQTDALLANFMSQVFDTPWFYIGKNTSKSTTVVTTSSLMEQRLLEQFVEMEKNFTANGILPKQLIAVSSNEPFLVACKKRGYLTCRYRPADALYGQVSTDMTATNALEIQDALEELNGVALRASAFASRSY